MTRREAILGLGAAMAALAGPPSRAPAAPRVGGRPSVPPDLVARLRAATRSEALEIAGRSLDAGAGLDALLGAVFHAGVLDIRPRHVGGKLHAVLMVESVFQLAAATDPLTARLLALWNVDDFKRSQDRDRAEGDWTLPPPPAVSFPGEEAARRELVAALEGWDEERADRAVVGLLAWHDVGSFFEILWPFAARSYVNIGHKIIYAVQVRRILERLPMTVREPALRSLVNALLFRPDGPATEAFERSRELAPALPAGWITGREDPGRSAVILAALRDAPARDAQGRLVEAFQSGLGPLTIWDALRLQAAELFLRRARSRPADQGAALLPVHAVTVTNAFGRAWALAQDDATRRLLILQAAGWLAALRDDLTRIADLRPAAIPIERLGDGLETPPAGLDPLLAEPTPGSVRRWLSGPERIAVLRGRLIEHLARRGVEHHQHKLAAALFEESGAAHPRWAPRLISTALPYLPVQADPETETSRRARRILGAAS